MFLIDGYVFPQENLKNAKEYLHIPKTKYWTNYDEKTKKNLIICEVAKYMKMHGINFGQVDLFFKYLFILIAM